MSSLSLSLFLSHPRLLVYIVSFGGGAVLVGCLEDLTLNRIWIPNGFVSLAIVATFSMTDDCVVGFTMVFCIHVKSLDRLFDQEIKC